MCTGIDPFDFDRTRRKKGVGCLFEFPSKFSLGHEYGKASNCVVDTSALQLTLTIHLGSIVMILSRTDISLVI